MTDAAPDIRDLDAWAEFCRLMGPHVANTALAALRRQVRGLHAALRDGAQGPGERDTLRHMAHTIVTHAGIMGFPDLSAASGRLDAAFKEADWPADAAADWLASADRALALLGAEIDPSA